MIFDRLLGRRRLRPPLLILGGRRLPYPECENVRRELRQASGQEDLVIDLSQGFEVYQLVGGEYRPIRPQALAESPGAVP